VPQISDITTSQTGSNNTGAGAAARSKGNQGISPPIANARTSPRPKIAQMTSGVGSTHQMSEARISDVSPWNVTAKPRRIATTVTTIINRDKLN
jgi:hypothetical protein